jgi:hypothetical protein
MAFRNFNDFGREELIELLKARDRRDTTRFGLMWEANEIECDKSLSSDFVALDLDEKLSVDAHPWRISSLKATTSTALRHSHDARKARDRT